MPPERPVTKILCVDDEPQVLSGIELTLRRHYVVLTATSGSAALDLLVAEPSVAVIVSDMRMPGMDGAAFLARARHMAPDAARILLTGHADLDAAMQAVNQGQIFRFLTKPCPAPALLIAVGAGAQQHRLVTAERVLLEHTLHGSIQALTDVLAIVSPLIFGRAIRVRHLVSQLASTLEYGERWQVEVAAMLSQLGSVALPGETVEKLYYGGSLTSEEEAMVSRVPAVTDDLLKSIPRLEPVRDILRAHLRPSRPVASGTDLQQDSVARGAQILRVAVDASALEATGTPASHVLGILRSHPERYDAAVLAALGAVEYSGGRSEDVRELPLTGLRTGMVVAEDIKLMNGTLLVARGYEVTQGFVERAKNFPRGTVSEPVRVIVRAGGASS